MWRHDTVIRISSLNWASTLLGLFTFDTAKDEEPPGHSSAETFNYRAPETIGDIVQAMMRKPMFAP